MAREKQMYNDLIEIFDEEYGKRNLITPQNTAEKLTAKGYRKASDVAREIFEEIEELAKIYTFPVVKKGIVEIVKEPFWCFEPNDLAELKKKYTESEDFIPAPPHTCQVEIPKYYESIINQVFPESENKNE